MLKEFAYFNGHQNEDESYEFDPLEEDLLYEIKKVGMYVNELEVALGHDWDELGYNSVSKEVFAVDAVDKIKAEACSFIYKAIPYL